MKKKFGDDKPAAVPPSGNDTAAGPAAIGPAERARRGGDCDLMALDKDGDKKISKDEAPERMKENFFNLDTNNDGFLDAAEIAALQRQMQADAAAGWRRRRPGWSWRTVAARRMARTSPAEPRP